MTMLEIAFFIINFGTEKEINSYFLLIFDINYIHRQSLNMS